MSARAGRPGSSLPLQRWAELALVGSVLACTGVATNLSGRPGPEAGLLRGKTPVSSDGVRHAPRLTDGITADLGDPIRSELTSAFDAPGAFVTYDLGASVAIDCAAITADARGRYLLAASEDGQRFVPLWKIPAEEGGGIQLRTGRELGGRGRYLRLSSEATEAASGERAVAELSAAGPCPARWPPALARAKGTPDEEDVRTKAWLFAGLAAAYAFVYRKKAPDFVKLLIVLPAGIAIALVVALANLWPLSGRLALHLVAAVGTVALAVGARWAAARWWSRRRRENGVAPEPSSDRESS